MEDWGRESLYRPAGQGGKLPFDSGEVGPITDGTIFPARLYSREQATARAVRIHG